MVISKVARVIRGRGRGRREVGKGRREGRGRRRGNPHHPTSIAQAHRRTTHRNLIGTLCDLSSAVDGPEQNYEYLPDINESG